jgi:hypothetical protein
MIPKPKNVDTCRLLLSNDAMCCSLTELGYISNEEVFTLYVVPVDDEPTDVV